MRRLYFAAGLVGVLSSFSLFAQPLTLNQAVSEALNRSPLSQQADSKLNQAAWEKIGAWEGFLPHLSASADYLTSQHYMFTDIDFGGSPVSVPQIHPTSNLTLQAKMPLFDGLSGFHKFYSKSANKEAESHFRDWTRFGLQRKIENEYYQVVAFQLLKSVAEQNIKTLKDHLRNTQLQKKSGVSTRYDVLRVEVQVSDAEAELLNAADNIEIAKETLRESLGRSSVDFEVDSDLPSLQKDLVQNLTFEANSLDRADLKGLEKKSESLSQAHKATRTFWVPKIYMLGQYQYYNNRNDRFDDWDAYRDAYLFGFSLSWNLFDGLESLARSQETAEISFQTEKSLDQARLKARTDFERWKRKFLYNCSVYQAKLGDVQKAEESVRLAREGRRVGVRTNTDFLDAESDLYRAKAGVVQAKLGAIQSLIQLELSMGKELIDFEEMK